MRVIIEVAEGPHQGQTFAFEGHDTFLVGRSRRAHFRLPKEDRYFSRVHFLVEVNPPSCRLMDMGSKNGTFVNGKRVSLVDLRDGDKIEGGKTVLRVRVEREAAAPPGALLALRPLAAVLAPLPVLSPPESSEPGETCLACGTVLAPAAAGEWPLCEECGAQAQRIPLLMRGYRLVREMGAGETGTTYLAISDADGRAAAIQWFSPAGEVPAMAVERFLREATPLKQLSHPYLAQLRELGECAGRPFAAAEFVRGTDARQLVAEQGPLAISEAVELVCQLLEALEYAHAEGYVHRDLKPSSLRVNAAGMVRVVGFGLAGLFRTSELSGLSLQGRPGKSLAFLAPEQVTSFREAHPAADQYAAAAVLYYLLTARPPHDFPQSLPECLLMLLQEEPVPLRTRRPDVPALLAEVVHRALAKEPNLRFPDVGSMLQALSNCGV